MFGRFSRSSQLCPLWHPTSGRLAYSTWGIRACRVLIGARDTMVCPIRVCRHRSSWRLGWRLGSRGGGSGAAAVRHANQSAKPAAQPAPMMTMMMMMGWHCMRTTPRQCCCRAAQAARNPPNLAGLWSKHYLTALWQPAGQLLRYQPPLCPGRALRA